MVTPEQINDANRALWWINLFKPWALAFVAFGVAYEFVADRLEKPYNQILATAHGEEMERLRASTAEANERTENLRKENFVLQDKALRLDARTEYRHLNQDQRRRVSKKMKEFSGISFALVIYQSENDGQTLGDDIRAALEGPNGAEWRLRGRSGIGSASPDTGVAIKVRSDATAKSLMIAGKLADALRHEGLFAPSASRLDKDNGAPFDMLLGTPQDSPIVIVIGRRP